MYEILFHWYYIPLLIVAAIAAMTIGHKNDWTFVQSLLFSIFSVICVYLGIVIGEYILSTMP
jgi:LytS/YehU family sensor histidine kinase